MATYNPPLNINSVFNTTDYPSTNSSSVSQSDADSKYLKKVGNSVSTANSTTFNNRVDIKGPVFIGIPGVATGVVTIYRSIKYSNADNTTYGYIYGEGDYLVYGVKNDTSTPATSHHFRTRGAGSTTENLQMTIENDKTTFNGYVTFNSPIEGVVNFLNTITFNGGSGGANAIVCNNGLTANTFLNVSGQATFGSAVSVSGNASVGTNGSSNNLSINGELRLDDTASPYTNYGRILTSGINVIYESPNVATGSFHIFKVYSGGVLSNALELQNY